MSDKKKVIKKTLLKKDSKSDSRFLFLITLLITVIILLLSFVNFFFRNEELSEKTVLAVKTEDLTQSKVYWENFLEENPTYLDGWLEIAKIYSEIGYISGAIYALDTAKKINPNSEKIVKTKKLLGI